MSDEQGSPGAVSAHEIRAILEKASAEPGINDVLALLRLSADAMAVHQTYAEMAPVVTVSQTSGTSAWAR